MGRFLSSHEAPFDAEHVTAQAGGIPLARGSLQRCGRSSVFFFTQMDSWEDLSFNHGFDVSGSHADGTRNGTGVQLHLPGDWDVDMQDLPTETMRRVH